MELLPERPFGVPELWQNITGAVAAPGVGPWTTPYAVRDRG